MIRGDLNDEGTFVSGPKWSEGGRHVLSSGRGFQSERTKCVDFLRQEYGVCSASLGHSRGASVAEQNAPSKGACRKRGREAVGRQTARWPGR